MKKLNKSDFYYELPKELIAQTPIEKRDESRLLVVNTESDKIAHRHFKDIKEYLKPNDTLVINNTRVMPSRVFGHREGKDESIEVLLLKRDGNYWESLVRPGKKMKIGSKVIFSDELSCEVVDILEDGIRKIRLDYDGILEEILDRIGNMPLPPYIEETLEDKERYQTVYSKYYGSAAAPTAGLHFTTELLDEIKNMGVNIATVTLHVGLGTFRPVKEEKIENHIMQSEKYIIDKENAEIISNTKKNGGRVIAVGTTSIRTLESVYKKFGKIREDEDSTDIFIYPGFEFKVVDAIITNFHLPESTLLMLISAFYNREKVLEVYEEAIREKYRFFSFGDAMFLY